MREYLIYKIWANKFSEICGEKHSTFYIIKKLKFFEACVL